MKNQKGKRVKMDIFGFLCLLKTLKNIFGIDSLTEIVPLKSLAGQREEINGFLFSSQFNVRTYLIPAVSGCDFKENEVI